MAVATIGTGIGWAASPRVLVHGDFAPRNLLFEESRLSGVLLDYDAIAPLTPDEWRMLLVDWWALLVSLAVVQLRLGRQQAPGNLTDYDPHRSCHPSSKAA